MHPLFRFIFLIYIINVTFSYSQTKGIIIDSESIPIDNVNVFLVDQKILIKSSDDGTFLINKDIPNNSYIEFYKLGYSNKVVLYKIDEPVHVLLEKLHIELDEIGIQETISILGNSKTINIENKSLSDNFMSSNSLVENISQLPGVHSIGSGLGIQKIVIRGLSGLRVVSFLNGMRISNQEWANDHGIGFTDLGLGKVELIKGSSSLKYGGDGIGGVLYFHDTPFVNSDVPSGFIASKFDNSHFLFSNQYGLKWSRESFYINMYGQHSISSDYRLPNNTYLYNSRMRNQSFKLSAALLGKKIQNIFRYQFNAEQLGIPAHAHGDLTNITLESITLSDLDFNSDFELTRPTQYINNHLLTFESKYFSKTAKYTFFIGHFMNNLQEFEKWTVAAFDMDLSTTTLRFNVDIPLDYFNINSGIQYQRQENFNNISSRLIPDSESNDYSVYTTLDFDKNNLGFNAGLRLDYKNINCQDFNYNKLFSAFNSSFGIFFKKKQHLARMTYSGSYRAPHLSELFTNGLHHGTMRFEIGDVNLEIEQSHQFDFKYQWNNEHIGFVLNPFIQLVTDFIAINPTDSLYNNTYRIYNYTQFDNVQVSGVEMNLHYHPHFIHNLHIEQSYSYINTLNKDNDTFLVMTPSNKIKTKFNLDLNSYNIPFRFKSFNIYHIYSFTQDNVAQYESVTNSYNILNMELYFNPLKNLSCNFSINNLLNEDYVPHLSRIKEVAQGVPNPGRSYSINLKYEF